MFNLSINKLFLIVCVSFILFNMTGCATYSVWEKRSYNESTVNDQTKAVAHGFYSKCKDTGSFNNKIIIAFKANKSVGQFPPFKEGYMVISSDKKVEYIIQKINEVQKAEDNNLSLVYLEANFWQTIDADKKTKYWSGYKYGLKNKHGTTSNYGTKGPRPGFINSDDIKIEFLQIKENSALGLNCDSLTKKPVNLDVAFTIGSLKFSEYKNSRGYRIAATPFAVIIDGVTSPFQLLAILTVPLWAPK